MKNKTIKFEINLSTLINVLGMTFVVLFILFMGNLLLGNIQPEGEVFEPNAVADSTKTNYRFALAEEINVPRLVEENDKGAVYIVDSLPGSTFDMDFLFQVFGEDQSSLIRNMSQDILFFESTLENVKLANDVRSLYATSELPVPVKVSLKIPENGQKVLEATLLHRSGTIDEMAGLDAEDLNESNAKSIKIIVNIK